jgi:type I restriction enzyme S subunit
MYWGWSVKMNIEPKMPVEWVNIKLNDLLLRIIGGGTPSKANHKYFAGKIPFMTVKDMKTFRPKDTIDHITEEAIENSSTNLLQTDTIIVSTRMGLGKIVRVPFMTCINQDLKGLIFSENISKNFIEYHYRSLSNFIAGLGKGTTVKGIKLDELKSLPAPLPPLFEQEEIAHRLDRLLAQVDSIKSRIDKIPLILKKFRQSVIASAVSGKLTKDWRKENQIEESADAFLKRIKKERREIWEKETLEKLKAKGKTPKNEKWKSKYKPSEILDLKKLKKLPNGWVYQKLDGLVYISARIGWKGLKASEYTKSGPLFLSVHTLNYGEKVSLNNTYFISNERYEESPEIQLRNDDILLCKDGAGIGKIGLVSGLTKKATINSSLLLIRAGKFFNTKYLFYFLSGPKMQSIVQERMTGSAVPHLFQRDVKEFILEIPPLEEQKEIVCQIEKMLDFADTIEAHVNMARSKMNNLTQSILAKAFRGELTAEWRNQNPDLITGKNSAKSLLNKIKLERKQFLKEKKVIRKTIKRKTGKTMISKQIIPVVDALKMAKKPLKAQELLFQAGYPNDADTANLEKFFLDIREQLKSGTIVRVRKGEEDIFEAIKN